MKETTEKERHAYILSMYHKAFEPGIRSMNASRLRLAYSVLHLSYEGAKEHALAIVKQEYPNYYRHIVGEEPYVLEQGERCVIKECEGTTRLVFNASYQGNSIGPCMCIRNGFQTRIVIEETLLLD